MQSMPNLGVWNSPNVPVGVHGDPSGHLVNETKQLRVKTGSLDPAQWHVDPGSKHYVDHSVNFPGGGTVHQYGYRWISNGVQHENVHRVVTGHANIPGGVVQQHDTYIVGRSIPVGPGDGAAVQRATQAIKKWDANGDVQIDRQEFAKGMQALRRGRR